MILTATVLFLAAIAGGLITKWIPFDEKNLKFPLVFAGAFLFSLTIVHLLPEIFSYAKRPFFAGFWILVGFFFQQVLDRFTAGVEHGHIHRTHEGPEKTGLILALVIHSILEGSLLSRDAPFHQDHGVFSLLLGISLHKIPAAFVLMTILQSSTNGRSRQYLLLLVFALASPFGLILSHYLVMLSTEHYVILFAFVSGIFLHISTTIFVETNPDHNVGYRKVTIGLVGALLAVLIEYFNG